MRCWAMLSPNGDNQNAFFRGISFNGCFKYKCLVELNIPFGFGFVMRGFQILKKDNTF